MTKSSIKLNNEEETKETDENSLNQKKTNETHKV